MSDGSLIFNTKLDTQGVTTGISGIGNVAQTALGVFVGNLMTGAIDNIKELGLSSIKAFARAEQNLGGVETLFKDSFTTIVNDADNAYKDLGMSANEYMEMTTSFAASLIQSTKGDTEKAAQYAKMAITDMSDNANKMGTDITAIQNAYQGFAKQNYTMLDNLKLGYGGTKTEMQRLLKDAQKITGIKYNIDNLNDVYSAIHVIQGGVDELNGGLGDVSKGLGIAGASAKEASTTIEGSMKTAKAAWDNLIVALADPSMDPGEMADKFIDALWVVFENIQPVIENIADYLPEAIMGALESLAEKVPELQPLVDIFKFLGENMETIVPIAIALFTAFQAYGVINSVVSAIQAFKLANEGATIAQIALNAVMSLNPFVLVAALIAGLIAAIVYLWNTNEGFRNAVINAWNGIKATATNVFEKVASFFTQTIPNSANAMMGTIQGLPGKFIKIGSDIVNGLWNGISGGWKWLNEQVSGLVDGLVQGAKNVLGIKSPSRVFKYIGQMVVAGFEEGVEPLEDIDVLGNVASANLQTVNANSEGVNAGRSNIFNFYDTQTSPDAIMRKADNTLSFGLAGGI